MNHCQHNQEYILKLQRTMSNILAQHQRGTQAKRPLENPDHPIIEVPNLNMKLKRKQHP